MSNLTTSNLDDIEDDDEDYFENDGYYDDEELEIIMSELDIEIDRFLKDQYHA